jgi:uncharacterized protein (TIGR03083 family)
VISGIGQEGSEPVLSAVRQRVLDTAMREREPRHSVLTVESISPVEAFRRTADDLDALLRSLSAADWKRLAVRDLDVQGLVGHLIGVERHTHLCLGDGGDGSLAAADHIASTNEVAYEQLGRSPDETRRDLRAAVERTVEIVAGLPDPAGGQVAIHGMCLPVAAFLVVRSFELWTHGDDIRRATGRSPSSPDAATLQLMTELAAQLAPVGVRQTTGADIARPIRLVLTGPGGGVWDLGPADVQVSAARIVTDAVDFCRLVAHRLAPSELAMDVWGDRQLIDTLLAGAGSLALD